ncbi:hypothetical protein O0L34_g4927 [Tuta absoluta]|nr:hypothetical protein O0L34_g4922 [Tuta absoluta]KAJ2946009.1 hypothetical protein O0L34_g4927 [Tuta absoluta]
MRRHNIVSVIETTMAPPSGATGRRQVRRHAVGKRGNMPSAIRTTSMTVPNGGNCVSSLDRKPERNLCRRTRRHFTLTRINYIFCTKIFTSLDTCCSAELQKRTEEATAGRWCREIDTIKHNRQMALNVTDIE